VAAGKASEVLTRHRDAIDAIIADAGTITGELADTLPVINDTLTKSRTLFPLLVGTLAPAGGFSVRGEGIIVHPAQLENVLDVVQDLLGILGVPQ
jgi:ABC-type transporter Mla subunit MlaD